MAYRRKYCTAKVLNDSGVFALFKVTSLPVKFALAVSKILGCHLLLSAKQLFVAANCISFAASGNRPPCTLAPGQDEAFQ
jgi:hypothetical protein